MISLNTYCCLYTQDMRFLCRLCQELKWSVRQRASSYMASSVQAWAHLRESVIRLWTWSFHTVIELPNRNHLPSCCPVPHELQHITFLQCQCSYLIFISFNQLQVSILHMALVCDWEVDQNTDMGVLWQFERNREALYNLFLNYSTFAPHPFFYWKAMAHSLNQ